jgi:DNA primase
MTVSSEKQIYKCFSCGAGGNVITFLMEFERIDFMDAIKILSKKANIDMKNYQIKKWKTRSRKIIVNLMKICSSIQVEVTL